MVLADVGLVDPGAGDIQPCWNRRFMISEFRIQNSSFLLGAEGGLKGAGAAGLEACVGGALQFYILYAALFAQLALLGAAAFGIDDKDVGLDNVERGNEVDDSPTLIDIGFLDGLDIAHHEEALLLWEHGFTVLILQIGGIGADADIEIAKL